MACARNEKGLQAWLVSAGAEGNALNALADAVVNFLHGGREVLLEVDPKRVNTPETM